MRIVFLLKWLRRSYDGLKEMDTLLIVVFLK